MSLMIYNKTKIKATNYKYQFTGNRDQCKLQDLGKDLRKGFEIGLNFEEWEELNMVKKKKSCPKMGRKNEMSMFR